MSLLQHDPVNRPSALQLSQSPLLPHLLQDDNFQRALKMIAMRDSSHHEAVLSTLFDRTTKPSRAFLFYNGTETLEHVPLYDMVQEKLKVIFRLHGAIDQEPPLLTPVLNPEDEVERTMLLDRRGQVVSLPTSGLVQFARLAARNNNQRIKRFNFFNTYRPK
jgi:eukaryotic translation initiation factor 2-alpha kinase 4